MKIGTNEIADCKIGSTQVNKVYLGSNLVWLKDTGSDFLTDLIAYYSFDGSNATDIHTGTYNGTLVGSPTFPSGKNSNCIDYENTDALNYVSIADSDDFSFVNGTTPASGSISMWVNFTAYSVTGNWLINKRGASSGTDEWQLAYIGGVLYFAKFEYNNNGIIQLTQTSLGVFSTGTWYHVVVTIADNSSLGSSKIYINGTLNVDSDTNIGGTYTRMNNGTNQVVLGNASWTPNQTLKHKGKMDEVAIWKNRELTSLEVTELYNAGAGKFYGTF